MTVFTVLSITRMFFLVLISSLNLSYATQIRTFSRYVFMDVIIIIVDSTQEAFNSEAGLIEMLHKKTTTLQCFKIVTLAIY